MSFRARVGAGIAATVAVAVVVASVAAFLLTSRTLTAEVDRTLTTIARDLRAQIGRAPGSPRPGLLGPRVGRLGGAGAFVQVIDATGRVLGDPATRLPVTETAAAVAAGEAAPAHETVDSDDTRVRVFTAPVPGALAVQVARPLDEVDATLERLRRRLLVVAALGIGGAALLGWLVAGRAVRPVRRLTETTEQVAATRDLTHRISVDRDDELGRLAASFNAMLAALERAREQQRQLVADASHELRTPLTSLRTNIEVLATEADLAPRDRRALLDDLVAELEEFGRIVDGLIELARGDEPLTTHEPVRLDAVTEEVVAQLRRRADAPPIRLEGEPCVVRGDRDRLARAIRNLVDNAVTHGGDAGPVDVAVSHDGDGTATVAVSDRGPGIAPADRAHVFDRFYRAPEARSRPGSGLGLAIVAQVARAHGGTAEVTESPSGGAEVRLLLPAAGAPGQGRSGP